MKKLLIILPAYNEAKVIGSVLKSLASFAPKLAVSTKLVVIDDGSKDDTATIAQKNHAIVISHVVNRGYGASMQTGIEYAKRTQADYVITFDSDGQHFPEDLQAILSVLAKNQADIVVGSRFLQTNPIPTLRRVILIASNLITFIFFGVWVTDSQSGFRGFNANAINKLRLTGDRMEASSEFFAEIKRHKLKYKEVPIRVRYTAYSLSKGQKNTDSFSVLLKLIYKLFQ